MKFISKILTLVLCSVVVLSSCEKVSEAGWIEADGETEFTVPAEGDVVNLKYRSNAERELFFPEVVKWIEAYPDGDTERSIAVKVGANSGEARSAKVRIASADRTISLEFKINQEKVNTQTPPDPEDPDQPTDPDPEVPSGSNISHAWFELPAMVDKDKDGKLDFGNELYYAYHFCAGPEKDARGNTARNFTVCYSGEHICPVWVAAPRHDMYVGKGRHDDYRPDPVIPSGVQYYSSKNSNSKYNRGHMLGSAERNASVATNHQVFYYSNIAPQLASDFNTGGGGWNLLEDHIDGLVVKDTLYEVVGCYFEEFTDGYGYTSTPEKILFCGRTDVSKPTMFYYALLRTKKGNTGKSVSDCSADELQCVAFARAHTNNLRGQKPTAKEMMSIADLEKLTGFTYFTNVPNAPKTTFNPSDWL